MMRNLKNGFSSILILFIAAGLVLAGFVIFGAVKKGPTTPSSNTKTVSQKWSAPIKILDGYADADVIFLGDGKYRLYFGDVPSSKNFIHGIFSAISSDGKTWKVEDGVRMRNAAFPDVIRLKDGSWRMYFQGNGGIQSASSKDGLIWSEESGVRIDTSASTDSKLTQVGASTTIQMDDGTYVLVYRATTDKTFDEDAPNKGANFLLWSVSNDGISFQSQGMAVDSQNEKYDGWLDGPDFSKWDDGWRLYFWTYSGIYYSNFNGKTFSGDQVAIAAKSDNPMAKFAPNPPGDPTVIKIGSTWYMYYGSNNAGAQALYYVTSQ